jgi:16S rRNA A1518/A1519 N6-dimethyltransferase RsmA/KsgA/DIM1 with predicted DNA glycosylase/AP lyase activity
MSNDDSKVAEIGHGLGDLTKELAKVQNVTAFEVDKYYTSFLLPSSKNQQKQFF